MFAFTKCWSYVKDKEEKRLLPKFYIGEKKKKKCDWNFSKERKEIKVLLNPKEKKG
jgi:hypothetical protein